jgi:VanZ family protein
MQRMMRIVCLAYVVLLSLLLLSPNPARVIGLSGEMPALLRTLMPYAHLLSFSVLAVAMLLAHWPLPRWSIVLLLGIYGGATEIIQGFIPPRTPEWMDWIQDLGGLAVGVAICSLVALLLVRISQYVRHSAGGVPLLHRGRRCLPASSDTRA